MMNIILMTIVLRLFAAILEEVQIRGPANMRHSFNKYYSFISDKRRWIDKCVSIILTQVQLFKRIAPDISIEPSSCWNCRSSDFHLSYLALDRCTNSPGLWEIVSCNSCGSTRTFTSC